MRYKERDFVQAARAAGPGTGRIVDLLQQSKGAIDDEPLRVLLPGFFVVAFVLCVNFLGDGLRDALDPTSRTEKD